MMETEILEENLLIWLIEDESLFACSDLNCDSDDCLHESDTSADDSDDDKIINRKKGVHIKNYIIIVHSYDGGQFKEHFRITRETCAFLLEKVASANILPIHKSGREKITAEKAVLLTIWYLANKETFRQISDRFDITKSAAHKCLQTVVKYLVKVSPQFIKWPQRGHGLEDIIAAFEAKQNINGIVGAIDGCHINIRRPKKDPHVYCNRKGNHSILLQGVVDDCKRFTDVFCGEAGSIHDSRMLKRSSLYDRCYQGMLNEDQTFLLGDSAYPNLSWLVVPFKDNGHLTRQQQRFNYRHSSCRIVVENAFGLLKGRFRRLQYFENLIIPLIVECVVAACVLHNICIEFDDLEMEYYYDRDDDNMINQIEYYEHFNMGLDRRQEIFNTMFQN